MITIAIALIIGATAGFGVAALYFVIWRSPKRLSYAAAKIAFEAAGAVVAGAQKELTNGFKLAASMSKEVEKDFKRNHAALTKDFETLKGEVAGILNYTKALRGSSRNLLENRTETECVLPEQPTNFQTQRFLQLQTIANCLDELDHADRKGSNPADKFTTWSTGFYDEKVQA